MPGNFLMEYGLRLDGERVYIRIIWFGPWWTV
jgi:hypothetical protein